MTWYRLPPDAITTHNAQTWLRKGDTVFALIARIQPTRMLLAAILRAKDWEWRDEGWFKTYEDPAGDYEIGPYHAVAAIEMQFNEEQPPQ